MARLSREFAVNASVMEIIRAEPQRVLLESTMSSIGFSCRDGSRFHGAGVAVAAVMCHDGPCWLSKSLPSHSDEGGQQEAYIVEHDLVAQS